jgi:hypothetical protein
MKGRYIDKEVKKERNEIKKPTLHKNISSIPSL